MLKIDIWTDYVCPYCYIGKRELENALDSIDLKAKTEIQYKAFELIPNGPKEPTKTSLEGLSERTGQSIAEARQAVQKTIDRAKKIGLDYRYEQLMWQNTLDA